MCNVSTGHRLQDFWEHRPQAWIDDRLEAYDPAQGEQLMVERQRELDNPTRAGECWRWQQRQQQRDQQLEAEAELWAAEAEGAVGSVGEADPCYSEMRDITTPVK